MFFLPELAAVAAFFLFFNAPAHDNEADLSRLKKISWFSIGMNGFVGQQSEGERLYRAIAAKNTGKEAFISLASSKDATPEAKLYAACGLHALAFNSMDELFQQDKNQEVTLLQGDILSRTRFNLIYSRIKQSGCD